MLPITRENNCTLMTEALTYALIGQCQRGVDNWREGSEYITTPTSHPLTALGEEAHERVYVTATIEVLILGGAAHGNVVYPESSPPTHVSVQECRLGVGGAISLPRQHDWVDIPGRRLSRPLVTCRHV